MTGASRPVFDSPAGNPEFEPVPSVSDLTEGTVLQRVRPSGDAVCFVRYKGEIYRTGEVNTVRVP